MSTVYRKTAKGQAEIETRAHRLSPRLRGALILVDGQRGDDELLRLIPGAATDTLLQLRDGGFIEVLAERDDPVPASRPPQRAAPVAYTRREPSIDALRRDAVRMLNDQLGPAAESVAMKIERAKTMPELRPLLANGATMLRNFRGAAAADAFVARFLAEEAAT
ncbi:MAG TPA: hypothetical protein VFQ20_03805 [Burkholderiaceae bacterium]|nr:hypothetical protein [Burkholderiaceae bacterium]